MLIKTDCVNFSVMKATLKMVSDESDTKLNESVDVLRDEIFKVLDRCAKTEDMNFKLSAKANQYTLEDRLLKVQQISRADDEAIVVKIEELKNDIFNKLLGKLELEEFESKHKAMEEKMQRLGDRLEVIEQQFDDEGTDSQEDVATPGGSILNGNIQEVQEDNLSEEEAKENVKVKEEVEVQLDIVDEGNTREYKPFNQAVDKGKMMKQINLSQTMDANKPLKNAMTTKTLNEPLKYSNAVSPKVSNLDSPVAEKDPKRRTQPDGFDMNDTSPPKASKVKPVAANNTSDIKVKQKEVVVTEKEVTKAKQSSTFKVKEQETWKTSGIIGRYPEVNLHILLF